MEAMQVEVDRRTENSIDTSYDVGLIEMSTTPSMQPKLLANPIFSPKLASPSNKRKTKDNHQIPVEHNPSPGVSSCYVFKSRLQEYAQKAGIPTPVYETIKEGPSHEPSFRSTVIVDNVRYDSLPGFFNRKAAEQSAAEVALMELAKSGDTSYCVSQPVHETGLCKNLLQEYAQKMNFAIPLYTCHKEQKSSRQPLFSCTVEIGGIKYIGAVASTKKEAEIKAARTALLAIQSSSPGSEDPIGNSAYTVIPCKKKVTDPGISTQETAAALKPKKGRFKKRKKRHNGLRGLFAKGNLSSFSEVKLNGKAEPELGLTDTRSSQGTEFETSPMEALVKSNEVRSLNGNLENSLVQSHGNNVTSSTLNVNPSGDENHNAINDS